MDYIDIINKAFRSILSELVKYIGKILSEKDNKEWWKKYVLQKLKETTTRNLPKNGTYDECLNSLDIYACLLIIIANWEEIFKYKLECKLSYIHELKEIRHDTGGHPTLQILRKINNKEYMDRALDTMALLMDTIDKIISDKIRSMKSNGSEQPIPKSTGKLPRIISPKKSGGKNKSNSGNGRKDWEKKLSERIMALVDEILEIIKEIIPEEGQSLETNYNPKGYIGFKRNGNSFNFLRMHPQKDSFYISFSHPGPPKNHIINDLIKNNKIKKHGEIGDEYGYSDNRYRIIISENDIKEKRDVILKLLKKSYDNFRP